MRTLVAVFIGVGLFVSSPAAEAWNKAGHMVSAAIAYADLQDRNPEVIGKVVGILKKHPHFDSDWAPELQEVAAGDRDLYLLMLAAKWPDDVRTNHRNYHHKKWHYVNIPYRPGTDATDIPDTESILTTFETNRSKVISDSADVEARAVALCWVLHQIGDVSQPLHTVKLLTDPFREPNGDEGGNLFYIKETTDNGTKSLHEFWDNLIPKSQEFRVVKQRAEALSKRSELKREKLSDDLAFQSFQDWAVASYKLAIDRAYLSGTLKPGEEHDGTVIPSDYQANAQDIAERQILLSGYRISDVMVEMFGK